MTLVQAGILGAVEGLTEFLPVSSTGHLILAARALGLGGAGMSEFEIIIQAGALLAVLVLYRERVGALITGVARPGSPGRALLLKLGIAFLPAAVIGLGLHHAIEARLFGPRPVAAALLAGGVVMVIFERWRRRATPPTPYDRLEAIPIRVALAVGIAQCLSLWPGTSRAMVTILAALLFGCTPVVAAEFSFLLAIPTLGAATLFDLVKGYDAILHGAAGGFAALLVGLATAAVVAVLAIRSFLRYLTRHGLEPFGWYRIALGVALVVLLWRHGAGSP
jgi:undecaprenyl-diphosphatase